MRKLLCAICALIGITASGKVKLPAFFADNMVLQQGAATKDRSKPLGLGRTWQKGSGGDLVG